MRTCSRPVLFVVMLVAVFEVKEVASEVTDTSVHSQVSAPPPALPKPHANPHIACFEGKYYIYPTTDAANWLSSRFKCWSSGDLVHWKDEGAFVIKRNGVYYLMWSSYDTRDPRRRSRSPM